MKTLPIAAFLFIVTLATSATAQVNSAPGDNNATPKSLSQNSSKTTRARVTSQNSGMAASEKVSLQAHSKDETNTDTEAARLGRTSLTVDTLPANEARVGTTVTNKTKTLTATPPAVPVVSPASAQVYRVGPHDVLDIQLAGDPARKSTLFTVLEGGVLEYPLAGAPFVVAGLTTTEIESILQQRIKIFENPTLIVNVRDYASHRVTVTGFVAAPGTRVLRREAVPLYALLAEALLLPEAARATITRPGRPSIVADLKDPNHSATLVIAGDVIKVSGMPPAATEFFFAGGAINSPGQKPYHAGITLTQAILASGGVTAQAGDRVRISRLGSNGRLSADEHNLRRIQTGKSPDPVLQKGDRIEVMQIN